MIRRFAAFSFLVCAGLTAGGATAPSPAPALRQVEADQHTRERDRDIALAEADSARLEAAQLEAQLAELVAGEQKGEKTVSDQRLQLAALNVREAELNARMGGAQGQLARLLGALELFRANPPPALFVDPHDVRDAVRAAILIRAITPELERRARALRSQAEALQQLRRRTTTASEALFTGESDLADRRAQIENLIAAKTALEHQARAEAAAAGLDVDALAARARALRDQAHGLAVALPPPGAAPPPDPEHAGLFGALKLFTAPLAGPPARHFGDLEPGGGSRALGWTWRPAAGAQVAAPAAGVVEYAEPLKGWGVVLILRLGGGYRLVLAGLDTPLAATGQRVEQGQPVGRMAAGSEFYFEIRKDGAVVDPARWLKTPLRQAAR
jgi:septal ring factor EnvC (AmiA/AmiB activator)